MHVCSDIPVIYMELVFKNDSSLFAIYCACICAVAAYKEKATPVMLGSSMDT